MSKTCKSCNGRRFIIVWQFPFLNGKRQSASNKKDEHGRWINGRQIDAACGRCNPFGSHKILWTGNEFKEESNDTEANVVASKQVNFKEVY